MILRGVDAAGRAAATPEGRLISAASPPPECGGGLQIDVQDHEEESQTAAEQIAAMD